jgi:hypothetical protein
MARVRRIRSGDGDSSFSLYADKHYKGAELFVVPSGRRAYFMVFCGEGESFAAFSGQKTLRKLARAILRAIK